MNMNEKSRLNCAALTACARLTSPTPRRRHRIPINRLIYKQIVTVSSVLELLTRTVSASAFKTQLDEGGKIHGGSGG